MRLAVFALAVCLVLPLRGEAASAGPTFQGDPQAIAEVQAAYQKFIAARSWRARVKTPGTDAQTMEHAAPDRFHIVVKQANETADLVIIGRDFWIRRGSDCMKSPTAIPFMNPREVIQQNSDVKISVSKGGAETIEGTPTRTYTMTIEVQGKKTPQKLYVSVATNLPRRVEISTDQGPITVDYFDYDVPIIITPPSC